MWSVKLFLLIFLVGALLLAACGGGDVATVPTASPITPIITGTATPSDTATTTVTATSPPPAPIPTSAPSSDSALTLTPLELLYSEDFEDGLAQDWALEPGWEVTKEDANSVLLTQDGHFAAFNKGIDWTNYAFKFRLQVRSGAVHLFYRLSQALERTRYYISFGAGGDLSLSRQVVGDTNIIAEGGIFPRPTTWHTVEIKGFEGRLQVFVERRDRVGRDR